MKKKVGIAASLLLTAVMVVSCSLGGKKQEEKVNDSAGQNLITVGFSQVGAESDWRNSNSLSMQNAFTQDEGYNLIFKNGQQKQANQITAVRTFIQQGVDYIVLAPVTESGWDFVLQEAKEAEIPVIIVDRMVDVSNKDLYSCWVGSDFELEGKKMAAWIKYYTQSIGIDSEDLHIVNIQGTIGSTAQIGRTKGLSEAARENGWDLLAEASGDFTETKGREVMADFLKRYDNINVVYCENDNEAIGAIDAIISAGKHPGPDIRNGDIMVVSFDGVNKEALEYAKEGWISCIAECNPMHGPRVKGLIEMLEVGEVPDKLNYVDERLFSSIENVKTIVVDGVSYNVEGIGDSIQGLIIPKAEIEVDKHVEADILLGNEQFDFYLPLLEGKRTALFTNHTGIIGNDTINEKHILDALIENGVEVTAVFAPEHGFRGTADAGSDVSSSVDEKTGVPILSLYGDGDIKEPSSKDMDTFDVMVIDIQDVGVRFYTYYISMYYMMEACAKAGKKVVVLDRPNPNGFYVDGPILEDEYKSKVGLLPIPVVHGMTLGELARMINGEGWLSTGKNSCDLTVIPCQNYHHEDIVKLTKKPSPNLKTAEAVLLYPSTCYFENTVVSVGRGTDNPFAVFGSPYFEGIESYDYEFTPVSTEGASNPVFEGQVCYGISLQSKKLNEISEEHINLNYLIDAYNYFQEVNTDKSFWGKKDKYGKFWVDYLFGTNKVRLAIEEGQSPEQIKASFTDDIARFKEKRKPYLLYQDAE